jgi:type I restriction enzyme S subunit
MEVVRLGDICKNLDNKRIPLNSVERNKKSKKGLYPYIGANNIVGYIDEYIFDEKILCIAEDGGSWGLGEQCAKIYYGKTWVNNHAHVLIENGKANLEYIKGYLNATDLNKYITGSTRGKLTKTALENIKIPLPSLQEQIRIAGILTQAENLITQRKESILLLDKLLKSTFLEMFGDSVGNEKGWIISNIGKQCNVKGGKRIPKESKLVKENTGYPYIKAGNIKKGKITTTNLEYLTPELRQFLKRYTVEKGDVCITVVGANIGDIGIVPEELHLANLTENANKVLIKDKLKLNNIYLGFYLMMDFVQNNFNSKIRAAGVPKLALFRIEEISLLMPPIELQNKFATIVEKVEVLKSEYQASLLELQNMYGVLSQKAFKGGVKVKEYTNNEVLRMVAETEGGY